jgi:hypothetical protein
VTRSETFLTAALALSKKTLNHKKVFFSTRAGSCENHVREKAHAKTTKTKQRNNVIFVLPSFGDEKVRRLLRFARLFVLRGGGSLRRRFFA